MAPSVIIRVYRLCRGSLPKCWLLSSSYPKEHTSFTKMGSVSVPVFLCLLVSMLVGWLCFSKTWCSQDGLVYELIKLRHLNLSKLPFLNSEENQNLITRARINEKERALSIGPENLAAQRRSLADRTGRGDRCRPLSSADLLDVPCDHLVENCIKNKHDHDVSNAVVILKQAMAQWAHEVAMARLACTSTASWIHARCPSTLRTTSFSQQLYTVPLAKWGGQGPDLFLWEVSLSVGIEAA